MDLSKILSISGKPGLFRMIGEAKNNIVVESLIDGKKGPAFAHERISSLKEISIYTETEDVALYEVFKKIHEMHDGQAVLNPKKASAADIKALFEKILPDYDKEAVYISDMKKVLTWYNFLLEKDILDFTEEEEAENEATTEDSPEQEEATDQSEETAEAKED